MKLTQKALKQIELQDDSESLTGGISYVGETADNFAMECELYDSENCVDFNKLNSALHDCGIKAIKVSQLINH